MNMLAIGNGEKCPFCDTILDDRPGHPGENIMKHLFENHKKEVGERLFPDTTEKIKSMMKDEISADSMDRIQLLEQELVTIKQIVERLLVNIHHLKETTTLKD